MAVGKIWIQKIGNEYNRWQAKIAIMANLPNIFSGHKIGSLGEMTIMDYIFMPFCAEDQGLHAESALYPNQSVAEKHASLSECLREAKQSMKLLPFGDASQTSDPRNHNQLCR